MYCKVQCDAQMIEQTRLFRRVCSTQLVLYLGRCNLSIVLVKQEHHGDAASSVGDWQRASTRGDEDQPAQREKITHDADPGCRVTRSAV